MNDKVTLKIELPQECWDAVCVHVNRLGTPPIAWIEGAVVDCVDAAVGHPLKRISAGDDQGWGDDNVIGM